MTALSPSKDPSRLLYCRSLFSKSRCTSLTCRPIFGRAQVVPFQRLAWAVTMLPP